jgi:hypothetical protein
LALTTFVHQKAQQALHAFNVGAVTQVTAFTFLRDELALQELFEMK